MRILAISVDPPEVSRGHARRQGFGHTFLSDANGEVIARYDLTHKDGLPGKDISRPAEFLVDPSGIIRWANLSSDYRIRARPEDILAVIDQLKKN